MEKGKVMGRRPGSGMALVAAGVAILGAQASAQSHDVFGYWETPDQASVVEIRDCGDGSPCGVVIAVDPGMGGMVHDHKNRDEHLRGRQMVGITLLSGFERSDARWQSGAIYNPKDGKTYRARLELISENELAVSGCLGPICKKLVWERARGTGMAGGNVAAAEDVASL